MKRKDFLRLSGMVEMVPLVGNAKSFILDALPEDPNACVLIPSESQGPFPLDLSDSQFYFRKDPREGKEGVQLHSRLKIIGTNICASMQNVRVHIRHCDKEV